MEDKIIKCIFCGKEGHELSDDFIKGTTGNHICVNCIDILTMLREDNDDFLFAEEKPVDNKITKTSEKLLTPSEI